ncbi:hypothetical protein F4821DRAFT_265051 [Hypoxylon rubiginosum]|uniref:Uncharacterized protein n=1 Tax=Hypoxylon rubiginosum TaxID=110542 RepID=A0ACC0CLP8_9PEZI|nr:hypothetical protein F4821DRAFT_265051 [Hypoxylon rubiginosum]
MDQVGDNSLEQEGFDLLDLIRNPRRLPYNQQELAQMSAQYTSILQLPSLPPLARPSPQQSSNGLHPFDPNGSLPAAQQVVQPDQDFEMLDVEAELVRELEESFKKVGLEEKVNGKDDGDAQKSGDAPKSGDI